MSIITVQEIERDPTTFLHRIAAGEEFLIVRNNQPVAEVKPLSAPPRQPRPYGLCAGQFKIPPDFDAPLSLG